MTGKSIDYEDILRRWKRTPEQAANDLERYLLRQELPDPGSVARAIVTLRSKRESVVCARWKYHEDICMYRCTQCGYIHSRSHGLAKYCPNCGAKMDEETSCKP